MNIPYVGSDVLGSSMAMNKIVAKKLFMQEGIPTAKGLFVYKGDIIPEYSDVAETLGSTFIVKPASLGSSVGVSIVHSSGEFENALEDAFKYDEALVIEEFINGRELECAIIGNEEPQASPPGEVELQKGYKFYSFDAKYVDDKASICHIPAKLDKDIEGKIKKLSLKAYKALGCKDLSRVDLFLKPNGNIIINEINTLPGFTDISMYPKLCEQLGISYSELITRLINLSIERNKKLNELETEYLSGLS
jgi:D-alanine-D-alanine ligase